MLFINDQLPDLNIRELVKQKEEVLVQVRERWCDICLYGYINILQYL